MLNRPSPLTGILMTLALLGVGAGAIGGAIGDARAQSTTEIEVPAQSLSTAVAALSRQTGLQITAPGELVTGRTTAGVSGAMAPEEALSALLAGTGLSFRMVDANTAVLEPVTAESPSPDDAFLMDQILVRGELQTRTLQETQTSVAVITGAELEGRPDRSLFDVIERTAGTSLGSGGEQVVIRGVPSGGLGGGAPVITTRIDGAVVNFGRFGSNATGSTWDLDQIEILRGPQSTQTGRNTLAGAIEIRSQDPIYDVEMKARAELGNGSTAAGAFVVNTPLIEDKAALRVALDYERTDGFVDNPTLGIEDYDEADQVTLRTGLRLDPTDTFTAILKYTHLNGESSGNGPELQGTLFPDERVNIANVPDREDVTFNAGNV
ncbi:MAG: TonB-dependent receptor, partial [Pseudomonadota bacterium]